jgi:chorismate-pyruvate lyase
MNTDLDLFFPLNEFYRMSGLPLPSVTRVEGSDVPEPYRTLLVHQRDMTPTLAEAYGRSIHLRLIRKELRDEVYSRQIILETEGSGEVVLFGAIEIHLAHFPALARELVLEGKQPLGSILESHGVPHASRPEAYFRVASDAVIERALRLSAPHVLYGRRNVLWNASGHALAHVVEILPPSGHVGEARSAG